MGTVKVFFQGRIILEVLISNIIPLADKALFVPLSHVRIELVGAEEALSAELAERVDPALYLIGRYSLDSSLMHRWKMDRQHIRWVENMLVCKHLFESYAKVAEHATVCCSDVQFEITPSVADIVASRVGTVEAKEDECVLHDLLSLEDDG